MAIYLGTNQVSYAGTNGGYMLNGHLIITKTYSFNLGQTNYSSITPSTTSQSLTLFTTDYTTTAGTTVTCYRIGEDYDGTKISRNAHDYVVFIEGIINFNYGNNDVSSSIHGIRSTFCKDSHFGKYYNQIISNTGEQNLNISSTKGNTYMNSIAPFLYQKADDTYATNTSYGIYLYNSTIASISTNNNKEYLNLVCPGINVRANDSYCPASSLQLIDPSQTTVQMKWYIYEGDRSMYTNIYGRAYDLVFN